MCVVCNYTGFRRHAQRPQCHQRPHCPFGAPFVHHVPYGLQASPSSCQYPDMNTPSLTLDSAASSLVIALQEFRAFNTDIRYLLEQLPNDDRDELTKTVLRIASRADIIADHARQADEALGNSSNLGNSVNSLARQLTLHVNADAKAARLAYVDHLAQVYGV